jgi:16S rRNA (adenine1518-N6/adenine1519-N6)-dimethyltransferase
MHRAATTSRSSWCAADALMPRAGEGSRGQSFPPIRKSLGQHFLSDTRILGRIADALELEPSDTVLEIGPGRGALTDLLIPRAKRVVAIEYDRALAELLREKYASAPNVDVIEANVLTADFAALAAGPYTLVGNVPYYITTPILFKALERPRPDRAVYLVQREVADRLAASPGSREYGALSVNVQAFARVERIARVPAGAFHPPPRVDSAVVRVTPLVEQVVRPDEEPGFRAMVQAAFGMRRKQLRRVLRGLFALSAEEAEARLESAGIDPRARPETLSPEKFALLLRGASTT